MAQLNDLTDLNELSNQVTTLARDAAYVVVGLGVLGFQRAQVQRVELQGKLKDLDLDDRLADVRTELARQAKAIDQLVEGAVQFVESSLEPIEEQLPQTARDLSKKTRSQARGVRTQIRNRVVPAA